MKYQRSKQANSSLLNCGGLRPAFAVPCITHSTSPGLVLMSLYTLPVVGCVFSKGINIVAHFQNALPGSGQLQIFFLRAWTGCTNLPWRQYPWSGAASPQIHCLQVQVRAVRISLGTPRHFWVMPVAYALYFRYRFQTLI